MTTLELFKKHRKGEVSRERFLYEVRRDNNLPWITNVTSYDDAVKILKNKGVIREAYENVATDPAVDRVNPYYLKRGVQKDLANEPELKADSYIKALNKNAKKLAADPKAFHGEMFGNFDTVEKADAKLQTKEVKNKNFVDEDNGMKKVKGQETPKAMSAPTGENKKTTKPEGVTVMKDKGVEGSEKVIKEIASYLKKKLTESNPYHDFHEGMQVETTHGTATVKEINGGTLTVETKDGKLYDVQMNHARHFTEKKKEEAFDAKKEAVETEYDEEEQLQLGDRVKVVYGNQFYGQTGTIEDVRGGFVIVSMDEDGEEYSMHSSDVEKIYDEEDDLYEARDVNDPALVSARARIATPRTPAASKERDLEILRQIKALKREKFQVMRDMEQEAEPEGGPIADDYADRLMDLDKQIKALESQLYEQEIDETSYAGKGSIQSFTKDPNYSNLDSATKDKMQKKLAAGGSVEL